MKIKETYLLLVFLLLPARGTALFPGGTNPPGRATPEEYNESFLLMSDRILYAVGETIRFAVFNTSSEELKDACWSRVIYLHLLQADGHSVTKAKYPLDCYGSYGNLPVPEDLLTGEYYLCAYTKWMRNFSPAKYAYLPLKIINPFSSQLEESGLENGKNRKDKDSLELSPTKEKPAIQSQRMICRTDKAEYDPGEEVRLLIQYPGVYRAVPGHISLTVARPGALEPVPGSAVIPEVSSTWKEPEPGYIPEIRGLTITGKILSKDQGTPVENARVELSVFGEQPRLMSYTSTKDGCFYFGLDKYTDQRDMFIAARHSSYPELDLRIDNDYASPPVKFPARPFRLNEMERKASEEIILNMQLEKLYREPGVQFNPDSVPGRGTASIHGIKLEKLWIDEYIELPNLKEVFIELVPPVMPKTRNKVSYLSFSGNEMTREIMLQFEPLILIDQVPIFDIDKLLALSPSKIRSIEVINDIYVIGKSSYGGFINIISKNGDMGGIDLPDPSLFFRFEGFRENPASDPESLAPDLRNCLFWEPALPIRPEQELQLSFPASDRPGRYIILVRGVAENGSMLSGRCDILVNQGTLQPQ